MKNLLKFFTTEYSLEILQAGSDSKRVQVKPLKILNIHWRTLFFWECSSHVSEILHTNCKRSFSTFFVRVIFFVRCVENELVTSCYKQRVTSLFLIFVYHSILKRDHWGIWHWNAYINKFHYKSMFCTLKHLKMKSYSESNNRVKYIWIKRVNFSEPIIVKRSIIIMICQKEKTSIRYLLFFT